MPDQLNTGTVRVHLIEIMSYLAAAARGNVDESTGYGPYRLLEGVVRVNRAMESLGIQDPELEELADELIGKAMKIIDDPQLARETSDQALEKLAALLKDTTE